MEDVTDQQIQEAKKKGIKLMSMKEIEKKGEINQDNYEEIVEMAPDDLFTVIYTRYTAAWPN